MTIRFTWTFFGEPFIESSALTLLLFERFLNFNLISSNSNPCLVCILQSVLLFRLIWMKKYFLKTKITYKKRSKSFQEFQKIEKNDSIENRYKQTRNRHRGTIQSRVISFQRTVHQTTYKPMFNADKQLLLQVQPF